MFQKQNLKLALTTEAYAGSRADSPTRTDPAWRASAHRDGASTTLKDGGTGLGNQEPGVHFFHSFINQSSFIIFLSSLLTVRLTKKTNNFGSIQNR